MKRVSFLLVIAFFACAAVSTFAQGGGKAEPKEIKFAKGKSSAALSGSLKGDEEMEYSFGAKQGQKVTVTNTTSSLFSFRIFNDDVGYNSADVAKRTFTFEVPETGDFMLFVKRKAVSRKSAKYSISLAIK